MVLYVTNIKFVPIKFLFLLNLIKADINKMLIIILTTIKTFSKKLRHLSIENSSEKTHSYYLSNINGVRVKVHCIVVMIVLECSNLYFGISKSVN